MIILEANLHAHQRGKRRVASLGVTVEKIFSGLVFLATACSVL